MSGQLHAPATLPPGTYWIVGWVNPRASLDDVVKRKFLTLPGLELRPLGRPARSQSLHRLRYPGSYLGTKRKKIWDRVITLCFECAKYEPKVRRWRKETRNREEWVPVMKEAKARRAP
jgi:hypothetical protein